MQFLTGADDELTNLSDQNNSNTCAYINALEVPLTLLHNLKTTSPSLVDSLKTYHQGNYAPSFCYVQLYTELFSTIEEGIELVLDKHKAELLKELICIEARKNLIKRFQDNKDYAWLVIDVEKHASPEYEQRIKQALQKLQEFSANFGLNELNSQPYLTNSN